ncbi:hypothetical protein NP233_g10942 [Leucocoprinus birnbaumii]|uniref:Ribonuclease H1 N-terminal domain-containing protein n=1 Tax=Leucocoprinus birnbaumii TaxID=56174 RepID=A0AAD5VHJ1_9AGAR|nr:hypothetical protein NP233_g10942 [Leucocoprinus birnbaumii]
MSSSQTSTTTRTQLREIAYVVSTEPRGEVPTSFPLRLLADYCYSPSQEFCRNNLLPEPLFEGAVNQYIKDIQEYNHVSDDSKCVAYAVYCGRRPSVYLSWDIMSLHVRDLPGARFEGFDSVMAACEEFCRLSLLGKCRPLKALRTALDPATSTCNVASNTDESASSAQGEDTDVANVKVEEPDHTLDHVSETEAQDLCWYVIVRGRKPGVYVGREPMYEHLGNKGRCEMHSLEHESTADRLFCRKFMAGDIVQYLSNGKGYQMTVDDDD